eukprot:gene53744-13913_t
MLRASMQGMRGAARRGFAASAPALKDPKLQPTNLKATSAENKGGKKVGHVVQIIGAVVDVQFPDGVPPVLSALDVPEIAGRSERLTLEVVQHLDGQTARTIAMQTTDMLKLRTECVDTGSQISVPVGKATLGRIFNVLGEVIDQRGTAPEAAAR